MFLFGKKSNIWKNKNSRFYLAGDGDPLPAQASLWEGGGYAKRRRRERSLRAILDRPYEIIGDP